jgi:hypothetical protein
MPTLTEQTMDRRNSQIERRLNELGSMVKGNQSFQADRIADVIEQIDELRQRVQAQEQRVERIAKYLNDQRKADDEKLT